MSRLFLLFGCLQFFFNVIMFECRVMDYSGLLDLSYTSLLQLASEDGINASGRSDAYNCIFGRDTAITVLKILKVLSNNNFPKNFESEALYELCKRSLLTLIKLQGKTLNIESGEEPGKFIHEYRKENFKHLINSKKPWFVYPDGILRNYDSIDSTSLGLIALYKFYELSKDNGFLFNILPGVEKGLEWIILHGDLDKDEIVEYKLHEKRKYGGLVVQSWTDSYESLRDENGNFPIYPIAPVEVQGYTWLALFLWADFYSNYKNKRSKKISQRLNIFASSMKKKFNEKFIFKDEDFYFTAQALDGHKNQIKTITGNPLLLLWAGYKKNGKVESILDDSIVKDIVKRSFMDDMFDKDGGIRTMSTKSKTFNPNRDSYHNGSFWPKLNGMAHEGLINFGFLSEAEKLKQASLKPILYFKSPIELYIKDANGNYCEYCSASGQVSCRNQAWSAASILDLLTV